MGAQDVGAQDAGAPGQGAREPSASGAAGGSAGDGAASGDPLGAVASRVRGGDPAGALAVLDALPPALRSAPAARYLRGRLLDDLRRPGDAAVEYEAALAPPAPQAVPPAPQAVAPAPQAVAPAPQAVAPAPQAVAQGGAAGPAAPAPPAAPGSPSPPDSTATAAGSPAAAGLAASAPAALAPVPEPPPSAPLPAAVREDAALRRALALARAGRCAEAAPALAALPTRNADVEAQAAACARAAGDLDAALGFARAALRRAGERAIAERLALADVLEARGDRAAAARELRTLAITRPDHGKDRLVLTRLGRLEGTGDVARLGEDERLVRAEKLLAARQHARCLEELAALPRQGAPAASGRPSARAPRHAGPPAAPRAAQARAALARRLHLEGMCLYGLRSRHADAARVLERAAALGGPTAAADLLHAARSLARADEDARAIAVYDRVAREFRDAPEAAEAEYRAAALSASLGARDAERRLRAFLGLPGPATSPSARAPRATPAARRPTAPPDAEHLRAARALLGFLALDAGRPRDAHAAFVALAESGTGGLVRGRGLYWAGRAAEASGDRAEAVRRYRETIAGEPLHWYALLSAARLRALGEDPGAPVPGASRVAGPDGASPPAGAPPAGAPPALGSSPGAPSDLAALASRAMPADARFYARLGLDADATRALRGAEDALRRAAPPGRADELLAEAHAHVGDHHGAYRIAARRSAELGRAPTPETAWIWRHAYPLAYAELVEPETRARALPRGYLWAVMRQESGYDPRVVSRADAVGLLQILPSTGAGLARAEGLAGFSRARLFEPAVNVRLSARYHQNLLADYGGRLPLAIAAYNAGSGRVDRWLRTIPHRDLDRFVEAIPIDETRNYVRRVVSHLARYAWLAAVAEGAPQDAWPDVPLPDRL